LTLAPKFDTLRKVEIGAALAGRVSISGTNHVKQTNPGATIGPASPTWKVGLVVLGEISGTEFGEKGQRMKNRGMKIKKANVRGQWVELQFMLRAIELGLHLNKPWGEALPYDLVVEHAGRFARVQVKSTLCKHGEGYECGIRTSVGFYQPNSFEYLVAYVIPEDTWYIIPEHIVFGQDRVILYPHHKGCKHAPYEEAWTLLRRGLGPMPGFAARIEACAEDWPAADGPAAEEPAQRLSLGAWIWRALFGETVDEV